MKKWLSPLVFLTVIMLAFHPLKAMSTLNNADAPQDSALKFYLVRHGQTLSNIKEMTVGGGGNAQLTQKGRYDASSLGLGLSSVNFIAAYSSTQGRAYETASQILRRRNLPVTQIENLKDISWGDAEGGRIHALTDKFSHSGNDFDFYFGHYNDPKFVSPVHAENMYNFSQRFEGALREIAQQHSSQSGNILVVAHSSMAFYLQKYRQNMPQSGLSNTSVSVLELRDGEFHLVDYNNTSYLKRGYEEEKQIAPLEIKVVINPLTLFNKAGVLEGTSDSDFTDAGIAANHKIQKKLANDKFVAVYSSELGRAWKAAVTVFPDSKKSLVKTRSLNEIFLGDWEAQDIAIVKQQHPAEADKLLSADNTLQFVSLNQGENGDIAAWRLHNELKQIAYKYEFSKGKVAVFTHPFAFNAFLNKYFPDYTISSSYRNPMIVSMEYKNDEFKVKSVQEI